MPGYLNSTNLQRNFFVNGFLNVSFMHGFGLRFRGKKGLSDQEEVGMAKK
jgi:hypothetical protein